ncbi:LANO_0E10770g1_1 [Lachancea nothofagi CBS 11611]|uniref:Porphobilinogen deaminase n=1 Tax=Lachancea nothofagi CBS 11611 TaxID=1266666 RepID=A0A1G4JWX7_9SACH|nr:LANO_0E10770g1_1 [Lachancea nothofagi CBS 11611]
MQDQHHIVKIGGRKSKLAVIQSHDVKALIEDAFPQYNCTVRALKTLGDQVQSKPLYSFGGKAVWTKELEDLLYEKDKEKRIDLIVHSLKDMPTSLPEGFEIGGITKRVDPSDCLIMAKGSPYKNLDDLPDGSVVGTSSIRRSAQLRRKYPKLKFESVRGNIETRLSKLDDPVTPFSCIVLASAGLLRVKLQHRITQRLDSSVMYHAVGQGALGIEIRSKDPWVTSILEKINDKETTICCLAERSLMRTLEGGCSVPIGVESRYDDVTKTLSLKGVVVSVDGSEAVEDEISMVIEDMRQDSIICGQQLAQSMIKKGAKTILDHINLDKVVQ